MQSMYPTYCNRLAFVNAKTNDPEEAYKQLLDARGKVERGITVLPTEAARITYEDLKQKYIAIKPERENAKWEPLDDFFGNMKATQITADTSSDTSPIAANWLFFVPCTTVRSRTRNCPTTKCPTSEFRMILKQRVPTSLPNNLKRSSNLSRTAPNVSARMVDRNPKPICVPFSLLCMRPDAV